MKILVLNGPNLNLLGSREPDVYGSATLRDVEEYLRRTHPEVEFRFFQSNAEGALIDQLHTANEDGTAGIVLNPGGYTHTSVALQDAISAINVPVVEVHVSNPQAREPFRHQSLTAAACRGHIAGLGIHGYFLAVRYFLDE